MANANTFAVAPGVTPIALNSTTETVILNSAGTPLQVGLSSQANFDGGRPFIVRLRGTAKGGSTTTLQFKLYLGTSATVGSDALVATYTAAALVPAAGGNFDVSATLQWDSTSQQVNGTFGGQTNGTVTATTQLATAPTAVASVSALQFVASAKFGTANATNVVSVTEFIIDQS